MFRYPTSSRRRRLRIAGLLLGVLAAPAISAASLASGTVANPEPVALLPSSRMIAEAPRAPRPCPSNMALVGASCVDKYEASLVEILADGTEVPYSPFEAPNGHRVRAVSRAGVIPQAHI